MAKMININARTVVYVSGDRGASISPLYTRNQAGLGNVWVIKANSEGQLTFVGGSNTQSNASTFVRGFSLQSL